MTQDEHTKKPDDAGDLSTTSVFRALSGAVPHSLSKEHVPLQRAIEEYRVNFSSYILYLGMEEGMQEVKIRFGGEPYGLYVKFKRDGKVVLYPRYLETATGSIRSHELSKVADLVISKEDKSITLPLNWFDEHSVAYTTIDVLARLGSTVRGEFTATLAKKPDYKSQ